MSRKRMSADIAFTFTDSESSGESSTAPASADSTLDYNFRTSSDYDNAWLNSMIRRVDDHMSDSAPPVSVMTAWVALKNVVVMHHKGLRETVNELSTCEKELYDEQQRRRASEEQNAQHDRVIQFILNELDAAKMDEWSDTD